MSASTDNSRPPFDEVIQSITKYVFEYEVTSSNAWVRARIALLDALGCAIESLPVCASFIGPTVKGTFVPHGFPLPGTPYILDPLKACFDLGSLIRYLDHSDAYPGAEWGHPSDNIGAILPVADWVSRQGNDNITMKDVFEAIIKAYEIEGCFQVANAFNKVGIDHVILVKIAATAVVSKLLGLTPDQTNDAISQAFADGHPLRIYRQSPNTSPRKGWAAGDACMRAVHNALMTKSGQPGYPTVLTAPKWGFYDTNFKGKQFQLPRPFGTIVVERCLFKIAAAEGHAISAVEAAHILTTGVLAGRVDQIRHIHIRTQDAAMTIINKTGPLHNAADRDHCMQYMVALTLLKGDWPVVQDYEDSSPWAKDARIDALREKMTMKEDPQLTRDYHQRGTCSNALTVTLNDGTVIPEVLIERPIGAASRPDTVQQVRTKFVGLTNGVLENPEKIWDLTMRPEMADVKVRDFLDLLSRARRTNASAKL